MLWFILKRFFSSYRHEGCVEHPDAIGQDEDEEKLEPYVHPFEIPGSRTVAMQMYGNPGDTKLSAKWERENMVLVKGLPGKWNKGKGRIYCHRKAAPAIREFFRRCEIYGVLDHIETLGCFNYRHSQHNPLLPLSYHSFGVAFDINPPKNRAKKYGRGKAPKFGSDEWKETWPDGLPEKLVDAIRESGFTWGGDWNQFIDPMHFQLVG